MIVTFQRVTWLKNAAPAAKIGLLNFSLSSSWEREGLQLFVMQHWRNKCQSRNAGSFLRKELGEALRIGPKNYE